MRVLLAAGCVLCALIGDSIRAADWPMARSDAGRTAYSPDSLNADMALAWVHRAKHRPDPAWPTRHREQFDWAFSPVIVDGTLYYGSSADGKVYALDVATGILRWEFFTDGPVRFAPVVWQDRLYVASDDGKLYCLNVADGHLLWKLRPGPSDEMLLGNNHLISRWPVRGGPVINDGVLYCGAGIWPTEQVFVCAVDPTTGKVIWCNDSSGDLLIDQPHPTARAKSGVACQGSLAVYDDAVIVPTGRAVPAVFGRMTGELRHFPLSKAWHEGGSDVCVIDGFLFNGGTVRDVQGDAAIGSIGTRVAAHPKYVVAAQQGRLVVYDRRSFVVAKRTKDRKGKDVTQRVVSRPLWTLDLPPRTLVKPSLPKGARQPSGPLMGSTAWSRAGVADAPGALIVAGNKVAVGGAGAVATIDLDQKRVVWEAEVDGTVHGLATSNGRLYASSDRGAIHCFSVPSPGDDTSVPVGGLREDEGKQEPAANAATSSTGDTQPTYATAAKEIIRRTGMTHGYCLDVECGDGQLALELARRTDLRIIAVSTDVDDVVAARRRIDAAGFYGTRVAVLQVASDYHALPDYFADLVVSARSVVDGPLGVATRIVQRLERPYGGLLCVGKVGAMKLTKRGPLEGASDWTHQNADPANTLCSRDSLVRGPLQMLWYRDTDLVMPNRHGRAPTALVSHGRMFVEGLYELRAVDIYNGRTLWSYPLDGVLLPHHGEASIGAAWTGSNFCVSKDRVYLQTGDRCLCLDAATGRLVAEFQTPKQAGGKPGTWGFIACVGDVVIGTLADTNYLVAPWASQWKNQGLYTESTQLFAMDAQTGMVRWTYRAEHSLRHNAIAVAQGRVFVIDRPQAPRDELFNPPRVDGKTGRRSSKLGTREGRQVDWITGYGRGKLVVLDLETGHVAWQTEEDVFGTMLAVNAEHDLLLMSYQPAHQATRRSEIANRMAAFRASDGTRLWDVRAEYESRPILNGNTIYAEPGAWDLLTGKRLDVQFSRSYGCGIPIGSKHLLLFRSATLGYCNLPDLGSVENYGGIRPGCWIPVIPAGGLVLMPDAASWCTCSYLNQATCALKPANR